MAKDPQAALDFIQSLIDEEKLKKPIFRVDYREDYQDFKFFFEDRTHIEIREKLMDIILKDPKHGDTRREILYLIKNAPEFEEWEDDGGMEASGIGGNDATFTDDDTGGKFSDL